MRIAPSQRFLGIPPGAPPRVLLGLPEGELAAGEIAAALERQRQRVLRHPAGREPEGERLVRELEQAANWLGEQAARSGNVEAKEGLAAVAPVAPAAVRKALGLREPPPKPGAVMVTLAPKRPDPGLPTAAELTEFDREVLATLVACGGWNHESRARLLAVASRHGVGSAGLSKVVLGLAASLRAGSVTPQSRARSAIADAPMWRPVEHSRLAMAFEQLDETFAREVAGDTPGRLARLVLVFVAVGALVILGLAWVLTPPPAPKVAVGPAVPPPMTQEEIARNAKPPEVPAVEVDRPGVVRPARWVRPPDLRGAPVSDDVKVALREALKAPEGLASVARRLQLEANRPSAAVIRDWSSFQDALGRSWPLLDATTRAASIEAGVTALRQIESDDVAKQFLDAWSVEYPVADEPFGVWRAAWSTGMLAEVAARPSSTAAVASPAIFQLDRVIPRRALLRGKGSTVFDGAAGAWLDGAARTMVTSTATDPASVDRWERWFEAQKSVRSGAALQGGYLDAIGEVLESGLNITESGRGSDLLGRLVAVVDWTERSPDQPRVRDAVTLWFTSPKIGSSRLWVLTSLLDLSYDTAWFLPEFVVDPDASNDVRNRGLERILASWPAPAGSTSSGGIRVDSVLLERWNAAFEKASNAPQNDDVERMRVVVAFARLNAAAQAMSSGDVPGADAALDQTEEELNSPPALGEAVLTAGHATGTDGEFTASYEAAGRDAAKRQDELRALRSRPLIGDLGPRDAEVLVGEALRGSPNDVRDLAQTVLSERFDSGVTVLQELLDQLPTAPESASTAALVEQLTRERLPPTRSSDWPRRARLAIVRRLLALADGPRHAIDGLAERLAVAYAERGRMFRIGYEEVMVSLPADDWMLRLVAQWRMKAGAMFLSEPFPVSLEEIDRRNAARQRLAEGPLQRCAAGQGTLLELLATVTVADRPALKEPILEIIQESVTRRARAGSVVEQLIEGERAIALTTRLLFEPTDAIPIAPTPTADQPGSQPSTAPGIQSTEQRK
jgi:hypothetical protein